MRPNRLFNLFLMSVLTGAFAVTATASEAPPPVTEEGLVLVEDSEWGLVYVLPDADLSGYDQVHRLPESQLGQLDLFVAAQYATSVLWASQFIRDEPTRKTEHEAWRDESGAMLLRYFARRY